MTIKEFIPLTDTLSLNEIYDLQLLLKRKAYERKEEQRQNIKAVENSYLELVDFVSKGLGFDIKDKSRKRDYTFARFAFVGIMHEKIDAECEGKKVAYDVSRTEFLNFYEQYKTANSMSYFDKNPIKDKTIAKDCQDIFCRSYESKIRIACAINRNGNVIHHTVGIKDFKGKVHYSRIILN